MSGHLHDDTSLYYITFYALATLAGHLPPKQYNYDTIIHKELLQIILTAACGY